MQVQSYWWYGRSFYEVAVWYSDGEMQQVPIEGSSGRSEAHRLNGVGDMKAIALMHRVPLEIPDKLWSISWVHTKHHTGEQVELARRWFGSTDSAYAEAERIDSFCRTRSLAAYAEHVLATFDWWAKYQTGRHTPRFDKDARRDLAKLLDKLPVDVARNLFRNYAPEDEVCPV